MQKTLIFIFIIFLGICLRKKLSKSEEIKGIKLIILNLALPATIFIALLKIDIEADLLWLPVIAIVVNLLMLLAAHLTTDFLNIEKGSAKYRTILMLFPSFAPGLSCFPFLIEYFGDESLANAAFADVGNKVFVLIILYLLALKWSFQKLKNPESQRSSVTAKIKELLAAMIREPINMVLIIAISMLCLGLDIQALPLFMQDSFSRISLLMTPLVLIFIGLSVKVSPKEVGSIFQLLLLRSGIAFMISSILLLILPPSLGIGLLILVVIFPQSACSFWPFAHMSAIHALEKNNQKEPTFDLKLSLNILAFSLPYSTSIILGICSYSDFILRPYIALLCAIILITAGLLIELASRLYLKRSPNLIPIREKKKD